MEWLILLSVWMGVGIIYFVGPAYLKEKGKNLATREDIGAITAIVERIRRENHEDIELLKAGLADVSEALVRRRDIYERLSGAMMIFLQGQFPDHDVQLKRQQDFLDAYAASWLWAPDNLIRSLNTFILMNMQIPAEENSRQAELKSAYFEVLSRMRKDAGFSSTELALEDLLFVHF